MIILNVVYILSIYFCTFILTILINKCYIYGINKAQKIKIWGLTMNNLTKEQAELEMLRMVQKNFQDLSNEVREKFGDVIKPIDYLNAMIAIPVTIACNVLEIPEAGIFFVKAVLESCIKQHL
jgi:hypothetical protein